MEIQKFHREIPTYDNGVWTETVYDDLIEFRDFVKSTFKEPGLYELDETSFIFNEQARLFRKYGNVYCIHSFRSKDYIKYWNSEKKKNMYGAIFKNNGKVWYLPRDYYMWINFLPIYDKMKRDFDFPQIWDVQLHMALYEELAELNSKHGAIFKKRQIASSYFHCAKMLNRIWFDPGVILKMGASLKDYVNLSGSWKFLEEYRTFLNGNTAWYRPMNPGSELRWQQKIEVTENNRTKSKGLKGMLTGMSFEQSATKGVGGACTIFFYEEAGVAPTMEKTFEFIRPALKMGEFTTGIFIAAGSVGELKDAEALKEMIYNPVDNDIYPVESNLIDETGIVGLTGLVIPEQWGMPPYIDDFGNSMVTEALAALDAQYEIWKKTLSPSAYQYRISQHPRNLKEGFAHRDESKFPTNILSMQQRAIEDHQYPFELIDLDENLQGEIVVRKTTKPPITQFPIKKNLDDKEGSIQVWERPDKDNVWGTYVGSIDPVAEGKAEWVNNLIYTPMGQKRIGDIKINDLVLNPEGGYSIVNGVFPQGKKELYRVSFNDGFSVLVCKEHLWNVSASDNDKQQPHILSVSQMLDKNGVYISNSVNFNKNKIYKTNTYYKKTNNQNRWKIPIAKPLEFIPNTVPLDSYFLGLLLGDGGISTRGIRFSSLDFEIIDYIKSILPLDITLKHIKDCDYQISTNTTRNSITKILRDLCLMGTKSGTKFVPDVYLLSSIENRLSLLQGLMDTDGYSGNHGAEFYSISKNLAEGIIKLTQSLGGIAKIRKKITNQKENPGVGYVYVVRVILPSVFCPFRLKRKVRLYKPSQTFSRYISNIEFEKIDDAVCISVDHPNHLYITENVIVTHNTITSESLCSIYIYKMPTKVKRYTENGVDNFIEGDKIVACWCGRFDDINQTHKRLRLILEWYNAWAVIENNISLFIQYMIKLRKQKYLVPKSQILFLKEIQANKTVFQDYGWKNTGTMFKAHLLNYLIEYLKEVVEEEIDDDGTIKKKFYGARRIPDKMAIIEMFAYRDGVNVDRLVALAALIAFVKIQLANNVRPERIENEIGKNLQNSENLYKLKSDAFRNIGHKRLPGYDKGNRSPFKKIR